MSGSESTDGHVEDPSDRPTAPETADQVPTTQTPVPPSTMPQSAVPASTVPANTNPPPSSTVPASTAPPPSSTLLPSTNPPSTNPPSANPQSSNPPSAAPLGPVPPVPPVPQPGFPQQGFPQPGYAQGPYPQPLQPTYPQPTFPQPTFPQQTSPQPVAYGYPNFIQQAPYPPAPAPDPAAAKAKRKRLLLIVGAGVVLLGLISAGIYVLLPGRSGDSVVTAVTCKPSSLTSCLIKAPAGGVQLGSSSGNDQWPQRTVSSTDAYASHIVTDSPGVGGETQGLLDQDGEKTIVHNDWNAVDGNNVDIVLLDFNTRKGAQEWNSTRSAEILAAYPGSSIAIPGDTTAEAHAAVKADSKGDFDAAYSTVVGQMVLNVAYSSPNQLSAPDLRNWAGTELASLRTAPAPAADPAPSAPGTEQVACGSGLQTCLEAAPGDGQAWVSPSDSRWVSGSTLSTAQFVHLWWEAGSAAEQQQVLGAFAADGVTGIAHEAWTVNSAFEQADIYLIQTVTAAGASKLAGGNFNEPDWGGGLSGVSYSIPNTSGTQAWYTNKTDSNGFIDFEYTTTVGNVIVMGWEYFYGSFDSGTANSWAEPQVDRIQVSAQTVPMGLFSLSAPTLPAAKPSACAASGECLMPPPPGATDTTDSSYQGSKILTAAAYTEQYEATASDDFDTWLASDGFVSGEHRSWTASSGATADAVLLKYASPAQAHAAALLEYGGDAAANRVCTDTAVPDSLCLAAPVSTSDLLQRETVRVLAWKGDYEVSTSVAVSNSADLTEAYTWAQQQLDILAAS